jgi:hypothetical protein
MANRRFKRAAAACECSKLLARAAWWLMDLIIYEGSINLLCLYLDFDSQSFSTFCCSTF